MSDDVFDKSPYLRVINHHARMADKKLEVASVQDGHEDAVEGYLEIIAHALTALAVAAVAQLDTDAEATP